MAFYTSVADMIGKTPMVEFCHFEKNHGLLARIIGKVEGMNPGGSIKDRTALAMISDAQERGLLKPGSVIIEPTSGNTGIGLASVAAAKGYPLMIVMPDTMSVERQNMMKAYGAQVILSDGSQGMAGAIKKAQELADSIPDSFIPGQFSNPANPKIHERTTGPEIWADMDGKVDILVAGIGTGGTITGTGAYLKAQDPKIQVVGVEPAGSPVLTKGHGGPHKLQGIGAGFVPECLDRDVCDEILAVSDDDAYAVAKEIAHTEGLLAGISAGAALWAAMTLAGRQENAGKNIVVILPDNGDRYLSEALFF
ncbi:MAG TPA: cysteine synthase A [Candidatus Scybalocola faecavium]|nr:cysteine synthase A [Candidatus Scybalocola faecavium]